MVIYSTPFLVILRMVYYWDIIGIATLYNLLPLFDAQNNFILVISDCRFFLQLKPAHGATN